MPPKLVIQTLDRLWTELSQLRTKVADAGGIALSYWGHPRSTHDIDLAILAEGDDEWGPTLRRIGLRSTKSQALELGLFSLSQWTYDPIDAYVEVQVDLLVGNSDYYRTVLSKAKRAELEGVRVPSVSSQLRI